MHKAATYKKITKKPTRLGVRSSFSRPEVARDLHKLLGIPHAKNNCPTLGYKIIRAVIKAITNALQRGERVTINGFGTFKVVDYTPTPTRYNIIKYDSGARSTGLREYAPRKKVVFAPSLHIMAMLNVDTPNGKERSTIGEWLSYKDA
jgi:hypothetical protein